MSDNRTILILLHRACGDTGKIGVLLEQWGYQLDIRCTLEGDTLPNPSNYTAVIVFGGIMSVNDCQTIPGIRAEIDWIPSVIKANVPYLGICLGAQLLARALDAGITRKLDNSVEIGFHHVRPTRHHCSFFPTNGMLFYQWHLEEFSIPENCQRLAESEHFSNQAFMLNEKTIGLQFHPEATREMIDCWVQREPENLRLNGAQSYKAQVELFKQADPIVTSWLEQFLHGWLSKNPIPLLTINQ
ncbi:MAG: glutamine amidotransferase-related protein [Ostreibacterium sp.]